MTAPLIGIDIVEPARLRNSLARTPELAAALFHLGERAYCELQRCHRTSVASIENSARLWDVLNPL
jgi:phosphopantetheinyl transferase (holo-ACP synthase)